MMDYYEDEPHRTFSRPEESRGSISGRAVAYIAPVLVAGAMLGGYAFHEHRVAQNLVAENQQTGAQLATTRSQVDDLTTKVNALAAQAAQAQAQAQAAPAPNPAVRHMTAAHHSSQPSRLQKMQSQLDAQNKAIEDTQSQIASTQGDLNNTRTELTGSIARTHDELVLLEKKGERNYYEFDIDKSKQFQHNGPFGVRLRKANAKHQYADLELMVDDRNLSQKHVNLYQPVMFYTPDNPQPVELVINKITKDHIHGYVSAPRYRQSELASMSNANANTNAGNGQADNTAVTPARQKLPPPQ
jgi:uncharacterized phage infection (PIP) family protein YhgE